MDDSSSIHHFYRQVLRLTRKKGETTEALRECLQALTETTARSRNIPRVSLWLRNSTVFRLELADLFELDRSTHMRKIVLQSPEFASYFKALEESDVVQTGGVNTDPLYKGFLGSYLNLSGVRSSLDAGVFAHGELVAIVRFEWPKANHQVSSEDSSAIMQLAVLLGGVVSSLKFETALSSSARALAQSEREIEGHFRQLLSCIENMPTAVAMFDPAMTYLAVSDRWLEEYNLTRDALGRNHLELFRESAVHWRAIHEHVLATGEPSRGELNVKLSEDHAALIRYEVRAWTTDGVVSGTLFMTEDVTAIWASRRRSERLTSLVSSLALVIFADEKGTINFMNDSVWSMLGPQAAEGAGSLPGLLEHLQASCTWSEIAAQVQAQGVWQGEIRVLNEAQRPAWLSVTVGGVRASDGRLVEFMFLANDITERKKSVDRMVESAKLSALGEMSGGMAHEINTPLAVIIARAYKISRDVDHGRLSPKAIRESAAAIERTANRIAHIVRGLRTFALQNESDELKPVSVQQLVADTLELLHQRRGQPAVPLTVVGLPDDEEVLCRPTQICEVLLNLLSNAFDAVETLEERWIEIRAEKAGRHLCLIVTDSGPELHESVTQRLFHPFFTTKPPGKGSGLGLSISKGIVESHGGSLRYTARNGRTAFLLELPCRSA